MKNNNHFSIQKVCLTTIDENLPLIVFCIYRIKILKTRVVTSLGECFMNRLKLFLIESPFQQVEVDEHQ